ncbi:PQQ-binding-like beta-propeller repeat protein [uncultured Ruminococcus sp.]|uniref:outer membrane protein assembly factor BamB family protein n=1 Tax=uncultured Ruminococcus sp. TaxID=165186 RepID=UPI0025D8A263|nr:PQQ-binding-like beta-propeller repeat protein [uncultured Ruminococcus sp.]
MFIRQMKASNSGRYFLAAEFEKKVAAFDSVTGEKLGEYDTKLDFGGDRMCISDSGKIFAAAAFGRFGITLYDVESGKALWNTKEVKKIQRLFFSADDKVLYAINASSVLYTLSLEDGSIISTEKGVEKLFPDSGNEIKMDKKGALRWEDGAVAAVGRNLLFFCSGGGRVYSSLFGGGLRCHSLAGEELWTTENAEGEHYTDMGYVKKYDCIACVGFRFDREGDISAYFLDVYSAETGEKRYTKDIAEGCEFVFTEGGEKLISSTGNVVILGKDSCTAEENVYEDFDKEREEDE